MRRNLLKKNARYLRKNFTDAERALWQELRNSRLGKIKFRRQVPMGDYILDFVCHEAKIIIEVDGGQHAEQVYYDNKRTFWLNSQGYKVLRFWNNEVLRELDTVKQIIYEECGKRKN